MNIYWIIAVLTLLLHKILPCDNKQTYLFNLIIAFLPLFIYASIRVDYGNDYSAYEMFFNTFHKSQDFIPDKDAHAEIGFQYLCYIMPSYRSILILNSFILVASFIVFIYKNIQPQYAWLAIFLIFLMPEKNIFGSLVGIRSGLVVTSFILTFSFIQERKFISFIITSLILSTIHTSAIFYLPLAYAVARNAAISGKEVYIWIGISIVLMLTSMSSLVNLLLPIFSSVANRYEESLMEMSSGSRGLINYGANLVMMFAFLFFAYKRSFELTPKQRSLLRMAALYCIAGCLGAISGRMTYYYAIFYIGGIIIMYSKRWKYPTLKVIMMVFVIMIAIYSTFIVWMGADWWNHGTYHSLFDSVVLKPYISKL